VPPKHKVRGSNPPGRASSFHLYIQWIAAIAFSLFRTGVPDGSFLAQTTTEQKNSILSVTCFSHLVHITGREGKQQFLLWTIRKFCWSQADMK
jgi:hypothetical protein